MLQFVPLTDAQLEFDPALYLKLVPFNLDYPCRRMAAESSTTKQEFIVVEGDHHE